MLDPSRQKILDRIAEYEAAGRFNDGIEDDPPYCHIDPDKVDYYRKKWRNKVKTYFAYKIGKHVIYKLIRKKILVISDVVGLENLNGFKSGAIITSNHFSVLDNFMVMLALRRYFRDMKRFRFYKVAREGNYAKHVKMGFFIRNCHTLPIGEGEQNLRLTVRTLSVIRNLLKRRKKILIYPEQSMWWNYKKPRPLKDGAFMIAAKNNAPILPCFITMTDSDLIGADGYPIQRHTFHILPIIYPDPNLDVKTNAENMRDKNYKLWVETYEKFYGKKLEYLKGTGAAQ
jgi:1-acyl-sn-glycerol-3-phosphate acyltransferase